MIVESGFSIVVIIFIIVRCLYFLKYWVVVDEFMAVLEMESMLRFSSVIFIFRSEFINLLGVYRILLGLV